MDILHAMNLFIRQPWLAFLPAMGLFMLFGVTKKGLVLGAAGLWVLYGIYELGMKYRILCSGECNIRIDLLMVYPLLLFISFLGVSSALMALWRRYRNPS